MVIGGSYEEATVLERSERPLSVNRTSKYFYAGFWVDVLDVSPCDFNLGYFFLYIALLCPEKPVQIAFFDSIGIDQNPISDAQAGELLHYDAAESPNTHDADFQFRKAALKLK